jgi:DNA polymerase-3 subunit epsilon
MREICLDTETTGLDPRQGHKVIEIACIELINRVKTNNHFHCYINPRRDVPQEAFSVHGLSTEFLQDKPIFDHIAYKFLDFIQDSNIIAHNASFDVKFLNYELQLIGMKALEKSRIIDSLSIARKKFPGSPASLDALCKRFNIDLSKRSLHGALLDTQLLCDVYIELMGGAQEDFKFDKKTLSNNSQSKTMQISNDITKTKLATPNEDDIKYHKKFILSNIKDNLWQYSE